MESDARCFDRLNLWLDPLARDGPQNMAVDEWLLGQVDLPLLRVYRWAGDWVSFGCFVRLGEVRRQFPEASGVGLVRRWTGGGIVDHRGDWTYSLIVPGEWGGALGRPRDSYRRIHSALAEALAAEHVHTRLALGSGPQGNGHGACFRQPVAGDLLGEDGSKHAGAAQRRTRGGLLHQGSVRTGSEERSGVAELRSRWFAAALATDVLDHAPDLDHDAIQSLVAARYGSDDWLMRI